MARKKKAKKFRAVTAVKELARERIGAPKTGRVIPDAKTKAAREKHKKSLSHILAED
jgi:hypothetical protein